MLYVNLTFCHIYSKLIHSYYVKLADVKCQVTNVKCCMWRYKKVTIMSIFQILEVTDTNLSTVSLTFLIYISMTSVNICHVKSFCGINLTFVIYAILIFSSFYQFYYWLWPPAKNFKHNSVLLLISNLLVRLTSLLVTKQNC